MGKYSRDLSEDLENKVKKMSAEMGIKAMGITIEPIRLKSKRQYGEVVKANAIASLFAGTDDIVCVAINEDLMQLLDDQTQDILIENLLTQIDYDSDKEKIILTKPEISVCIGMVRKYKEIAVQKLEVAYHTLLQMEEKQKEERKAKKKKKEE